MSFQYLYQYLPAPEVVRISAKQKTKSLKILSKRLPPSEYNRVAAVYKQNDDLMTENELLKHNNLVLSEHVRLLTCSVQALSSRVPQ